jgi:exonuclease III
MMSVFKVRDAFLALTYEQQAMIVDDWMERTPITTVMASSAPKVAATDRPTTNQATKYSRDGLPYDEREIEACDTLILNGNNNEEAARWFDKNRPFQRTHKAWTWFATKRRDILKAKGELK